MREQIVSQGVKMSGHAILQCTHANQSVSNAIYYPRSSWPGNWGNKTFFFRPKLNPLWNRVWVEKKSKSCFHCVPRSHQVQVLTYSLFESSVWSKSNFPNFEPGKLEADFFSQTLEPWQFPYLVCISNTAKRLHLLWGGTPMVQNLGNSAILKRFYKKLDHLLFLRVLWYH